MFDCFSFCWDVAALLSAFLVFTIAVDFEVSFFLSSFLLELIEYMYICIYLTLLAFLFEGCALCLPLSCFCFKIYAQRTLSINHARNASSDRKYKTFLGEKEWIFLD